MRTLLMALVSFAMWLAIDRPLPAIPEAEVRLSADFSKPTRALRGGIGASWHAIEAEMPTGVKHPVFAGPAHGGSAWGGNPPAEDHARWKQIERLAAWRNWATARGKPLFLSEVGTMVYGWRTNNPGPAQFEAALKDAELVVRGLNAGVEGFNRWSFINRVFATALRGPRGNFTWLIVNDAPRSWPATLELRGSAVRTLHKYQVTSEQRDQPGLRIQPLSQVKLAKSPASFADTLPAQSLTVLSTYALDHSASGVMAD